MIRVTARHEQSGATYDVIDVRGAFVIFGRGDDRLALPIGMLSTYDYFKHNVRCGDVLRDIRDGQLWVVEYTYRHGLRMTYFGLINYERVGRKYSKRDRQPHERANAIADVVNRVTREVAQKMSVEFRKSQPAYATYDARQVQARLNKATHEIINHVTNAQRMAREYGVGFIRVEQDGSMSAIDPRSVILK